MAGSVTDMDQFVIENYRCFYREQTARLAPLTLLVGDNSTGKTSFLALLRSLWDYAFDFREPDFKLDPFDLGSFDEISHHRGARGGQADTFTASFSLHSYRTGTAISDETPFEFKVVFGKQGTVPIPIERHIKIGAYWTRETLATGKSSEIQVGTPRGSWNIVLPKSIREQRSQMLGRPFEISIVMQSFFSVFREEKDTMTAQTIQFKEDIFRPLASSPPLEEEDAEALATLAWTFAEKFIPDDAKQSFASAPVRSKPRRTYDPAKPAPDPEGDYIPMLLANEFSLNEEGWNDLKAKLERFGAASGLFHDIAIKKLGQWDSAPFQVQIRKRGQQRLGPYRNLIDMGYGISQVLPVLTELMRAPRSPLMLLQQPEVHLHPSAQAALGSLFCQIAGSNRRLVVETHSDHLLDRVRMDIRDKASDLTPDDVSILFFDREDLDTRIHSIRIDEYGNIQDAPPSYRQFFLEEIEKSLGI